MKKLFFTMVALVVATMSYAQSSQIATLSHEGSISTFYGNSALKEAMTAEAGHSMPSTSPKQ